MTAREAFFGGGDAEDLVPDADCLEAMQTRLLGRYPRHYNGRSNVKRTMKRFMPFIWQPAWRVDFWQRICKFLCGNCFTLFKAYC
jgi:hypothetical protein